MRNKPAHFKTLNLAVIGSGLLMASLQPVSAAETVPTQEVALQVETLTTGLSHPWAAEDLPDGEGILITERDGNLRLFANGTLSAPIGGLPEIASVGQGGLLDVALAPDFATSRVLFLSLSVPGRGGQGTAIIRARFEKGATRLRDVTEIFRMNRFTGSGQHFGSRIAVTPNGSLFFTIGDRGDGDRAQDGQDHAGAVLHIAADGSIPPSNPYAGGGALPEIWSKGHRNPQGLAIDPQDGTLWAVEHGARGGDEVNRPEPGRNYGWPVISFGRHYSGAEIGIGTAADGYEQPVHYWDPSIAPGGMTVYRGTMFPEWDGDLLVAALKYQMLVRLDTDPKTKEIHSEERILKGDYGRIRDVTVANDGSLLLVTDEGDGALIRIFRDTSATE